MPKGIVLLAVDCPATRIVYHALAKRFGNPQVVFEDGVSRLEFIRRRVKRLGLVTVTGQVLFLAALRLVLSPDGKRRVQAIRREFGLDDSPIEAAVHRVPSINSAEARQILRQLDPCVVVISGTRIIGRETLAAIKAPFLNMHAGITPLYRGVHGGYWALVEGRPDLVGTTVHLLDEGIDTGEIIDQVTFGISRDDSFVTYPYLHTAAGLPALISGVQRGLDGKLEGRPGIEKLSSKLRSHPTLWGYLANRILKGVR